MTARHLDLTATAGETLNVGVRFHVPGAGVPLETVAAGDWVFYKGDPWPVHAIALQPDGLARIRLGRGSFWEPDLVARPDTLAYPATPATISGADVAYRTNTGTWALLPFGLAAAGTEVRVLPHDSASSAFTAALAATIEAEGGPASFEWQVVATFVEVPGVRRLAEGALAIIPALALLEV